MLSLLTIFISSAFIIAGTFTLFYGVIKYYVHEIDMQGEIGTHYHGNTILKIIPVNYIVD